MVTSTKPISEARQRAFRAQTFRLKKGDQLRSVDDAVAYVEERGFVYFWPIKGVDLPSLWTAVAGDRPVADKHNDPGHVTWGWKDSQLGTRRWYYGKLLRGKSTMVSLATLPYFYALSENYGDPDDYLMEDDAGRLTQEARQIYEALAGGGPMDSLKLRREARLAGKESSGRFERALADLQRGLRVLPVGVAEAGSWKYAFIYELVTRWYPDLPAQARPIGRAEARAHLAGLLLQSVGVSTPAGFASLLGWSKDDALGAADRLVASGLARRAPVAGRPAGDWLAAPELVDRL